MLYDYRTNDELFPDPDVCRHCGEDVADCGCNTERRQLRAEYTTYSEPVATDYGYGTVNPDTITRDDPEYWDMSDDSMGGEE